MSLGLALTMLTLIVLIPLAALALRAAALGPSGFYDVISDPRVFAALKVSFLTALAAAIANAIFGTLTAWVLVRYNFFGRRIFDALIDLPFAMPTAVAGIALVTVYSPKGLIGQWLAPLGIRSPIRRSASSWR